MRMGNGAPFKAYRMELERFCAHHADHPRFRKEAQILSKAVQRLTEVALEMKRRMSNDPLQWASNTYPALICFGDVTVTWRLLDMAVIAHKNLEEGKESAFYTGKILQASYFAETTLPLTMARLETCVRKGREITDMPDKAF
jgi:hypothetical protein